MAYALVGALGAPNQGASGGGSAPQWGVGESRTAGNLLVCWIVGTGTAAVAPVPSGWSQALSTTGTLTGGAIYYKIAAGADAAPIFSGISSNLLAAQLGEFSGNASASPVDKFGNTAQTTQPVTVTNGNGVAGNQDVQAGELFMFELADRRSAARAPNDTWTSTSGTVVAAGNNNGVSSADHYSFGYLITTSNAAADTATATASVTTSLSGFLAVSASFKLAAAGGGGGDDSFPVIGGGLYPLREYAERARRRFWRSGWARRPSGVLVPA